MNDYTLHNFQSGEVLMAADVNEIDQQVYDLTVEVKKISYTKIGEVTD